MSLALILYSFISIYHLNQKDQQNTKYNYFVKTILNLALSNDEISVLEMHRLNILCNIADLSNCHTTEKQLGLHRFFQLVIHQHCLVHVWQVWDKTAQPCCSLEFNKEQRSARGSERITRKRPCAPAVTMKPFFSLLTTVLNPRTHNFVELAEQVCRVPQSEWVCVKRYDQPGETIWKDALVGIICPNMQSRTCLHTPYIFIWLKQEKKKHSLSTISWIYHIPCNSTPSL